MTARFSPAVHPSPLPIGGWLVFGNPALQAMFARLTEAIVPVTDGVAFRAALEAIRPRLVVIAEPAARWADAEAALAARRRRVVGRLLYLNDPADPSARVRALESGFDDALPLSVDRTELIGRARILATRGARGADGVPRMNRSEIAVTIDIGLDPIGRRVRRHGIEIHVRPKELALLEVLVTHPGRAFSRGELLDRVWGAARVSDARTVDVHIRWLRAKLEHDPAHPTHLVTVRGLGYRFDPPPGDEPETGAPAALIES
jgi:DNA-binding response OmpR family regulator